MIRKQSAVFGRNELSKLAALFRVGASTIRDIASLRRENVMELDKLAEDAEAIGDDLDRIADRGPEMSIVNDN